MRAFELLPELNPFLTQMKEQEEGNFICCEKKQWKRVHKLPLAVELLGWNQKKGFKSSEKHKLHQEWMFRVNGCAGVGCVVQRTRLHSKLSHRKFSAVSWAMIFVAVGRMCVDILCSKSTWNWSKPKRGRKKFWKIKKIQVKLCSEQINYWIDISSRKSDRDAKNDVNCKTKGRTNAKQKLDY